MIEVTPGTWMAKCYIALRRYRPDLFDARRACALKIGIYEDISSDPHCPLDELRLKRFLRWWTRQPDYLTAVFRGDRRIGLVNYHPLDDRHRLHAANRLAAKTMAGDA